MTDRFCARCGQKADTHRFSMKHLLTHDVVHGIWHVDKGILFTIRELVCRPGHAIREFVDGQRSRHFHFFTLTLLLLTVSHFLDEMATVSLADLLPGGNEHNMASVEKIFRTYPRAITLGAVPLYALCSFAWFRKAKLNLAEHLVLNAYRGAGELIISLLFALLAAFCRNKAILAPAFSLMSVLVLVYSVWFYCQYFSAFGYSRFGLFLRSIATILTAYAFVTLLVSVAARYLLH